MVRGSSNTYNESSLHNTLKIFYAEKIGGETEVECEGHIFDVLGKDGQVVEIQTKNLSKLAGKIRDALNKGHKVTLVYPLVYRTRIITTDDQGKPLSNRLSPKKGCIYDIFRELTGLTDILLNKKFRLEVLTINMIEHRVRTGEPVQTANKSRRFKRNWIKVNKRLDEILESRTFHKKTDYTSLLPQGLPAEFSAKDIAKADPFLTRYAHLMLWVLVRIPVIEQTSIQNKSRHYKIK